MCRNQNSAFNSCGLLYNYTKENTNPSERLKRSYCHSLRRRYSACQNFRSRSARRLRRPAARPPEQRFCGRPRDAKLGKARNTASLNFSSFETKTVPQRLCSLRTGWSRMQRILNFWQRLLVLTERKKPISTRFHDKTHGPTKLESCCGKTFTLDSYPYV